MLILLRHGRTEANAKGLLQGRSANPLDAVGRAQANAAAAALGRVDRVIATSLVRAQQTAAAFDMPVETDDRFIELDYGNWEGRPVAEVAPEVWGKWRADPDFAPPGGESLAVLSSRVRAGLDEIAASATNQTIVIVSHVSPIKASVTWALGVDDATTWRMHLSQAAICRIALRGRSPVLVSYNDVAHLEGLDEH